ncbi:hypothetical protein EDC01DRAFT_644534 [Geopyxis carbonaria]|nr:hypothetical protein EDC01DRAFT_644534 [Geopyxis carbonaria]
MVFVFTFNGMKTGRHVGDGLLLGFGHTALECGLYGNVKQCLDLFPLLSSLHLLFSLLIDGSYLHGLSKLCIRVVQGTRCAILHQRWFGFGYVRVDFFAPCFCFSLLFLYT